MANNKPIEEWLNEQPSNTSPSDSATLLGLDNGETVQIPIDKFAVIETDETIPERKILTGDYNITGTLFPKEGVLLEDGRGITLYGQYDRGHTYVDLHSNEDCKIEYTAKADDDTYTHDFLATESFVEEKVAGIVNSAPETLDTLNELSKALGNDPNFAASVATQIGNKVDKVSGKGLSTNDYTTAEKNKLAGLSTVATSGSYNDLKDKPSIPSAYSHPASHPASMITGLAKVATSGSYNDLTDKPTIPSIAGLATEQYVDEKISSLPSGGGSSSGGTSSSGGGIVPVDALPTEGVANTIYKVYELDNVKLVDYVEDGEGNLIPTTVDEGITTEVVEELPETGTAMVDMTTDASYFYYNKADGKLYGYITQELSDANDGALEVGWMDAALMMGMGEIVFVNSLDEVEYSETIGYALLIKKPHLYIYEGGWLEIPLGFRLVYNSADASITIIES